MKVDIGEKIDPVTRERMRLAGLALPGEEPEEVSAWKKKLVIEERVREMASTLAVERGMEVDAAFEYAERFVARAFERYEELQRQKPTRLS